MDIHYPDFIIQLQDLATEPELSLINNDFLLHAIEFNDIVQVQSALSLEPILTAIPQRNIPSPLCMAIYKSTPEIVALLINSGADIHERQSPSDFYPDHAAYECRWNYHSFSDGVGFTFHSTITLLHWAVMMGDVHKVKVLLNHGADAAACDSQGISVLQYAVESQNLAVAEELLIKGANANFRTSQESGNYLLHDAVRTGNGKLVKLLLRYGAEPWRKNYRGQMALHMVATAASENVEVAEILVRAGAPVDDFTRRYYKLPQRLIKGNTTDLVRRILLSFRFLLSLFSKKKNYAV